MSRLSRIVDLNPLLSRELRGRMRGLRATLSLTFFLLLIGFLALLILAIATQSYTSSATSDAGQAIFYTIFVVEILVTVFITPSLTTGSISGERERKTYDLLRVTLLSPAKLVLGKLGAAIAYVLLLLAASLPVTGLALMLGGVEVSELVLGMLILLVSTFFYGTLGLFFSSLMRSTRGANTLTYITLFVLLFGLPIILSMVGVMLPATYMMGPSTDWEPSPTVLALIIYAAYLVAVLHPLGASIATEVILRDENSIWGYYQTLEPISTAKIPIPSGWIIYTVVYLLLGILLLLIATWRVRRPEKG